jgi:signal transduction histidine kinase
MSKLRADTATKTAEADAAPETRPQPPPHTDAPTRLGIQQILERFALLLSPHFAQAPESLRPHPQEAPLAWLWRIAPAQQQREALNQLFAPLRGSLDDLQRQIQLLLTTLRRLQQHPDVHPGALALTSQRAARALEVGVTLQQALNGLQEALPDTRALLQDEAPASPAALLGESQRALLNQLARFALHEISNPLTATLTNLYEGRRVLALAATNATAAPWAELLDIYRDAQEGALRAQELLQDLGRWGEPLAPTAHTLISVEELVHLALRLHHPGHVALRVELEPNLTLRGDRGQLLQILLNLLNNAREAIGAHPVDAYITLRARRQSHAICLEVINPRVPLPGHLLGSLFEPFVSGSPNRHGLGLPICRELAALHGGTLDLSVDQREISFCLRLPTHD